jgi:hypothetical protein
VEAAVPSEAQRFVFARCAGALEGMLGAVAERRMPGEEADLAAELNAMMPAAEPVAEEVLAETAEAVPEPVFEPAVEEAPTATGLRRPTSRKPFRKSP